MVPACQTMVLFGGSLLCNTCFSSLISLSSCKRSIFISPPLHQFFRTRLDLSSADLLC